MTTFTPDSAVPTGSERLPVGLQRSGEAGMTIVSTLVGAVIIGIVTGMAVYVLMLGQNTVRVGIRRGDAQRFVLEALQKMTPELRQSGPITSGSGVTVYDADGETEAGEGDGPGPILVFRKITGYTIDGSGNFVRSWSPELHYFKYDAGSQTIEHYVPDLGLTRNIAGMISSCAFSRTATGDGIEIRMQSTITWGRDVTVFPEDGPLLETVPLRNGL